MKSSLCAWTLLVAGAIQAAVAARPPAVHGAGQYPAAEKGCLQAVAKKTGVDRSRLRITDVSRAQAGVGITVKVPGAHAPWSCLADEKGRVQGVGYTGTERRM